MGKRVLVTGGGIDGVQSALDLADAEIEVVLLEKSAALCPDTPGNHRTRPRTLLLAPKLLRAISHPNIRVITGASLVQLKGDKGDFKATVSENPRYVSADLCTSCGRCERECPVDIVPHPVEANRRHKAIHRPGGLKSIPSTYVIDKRGLPPCTAACPGGVNTHGFVALIAKGKFTEALDLITEAVPFPRVLGRVCGHPCQSYCARSRIDHAVSICALKRFVADNNSTHSSLMRTQSLNGAAKPTGTLRIAIIGAGPAGLTAARDLARLGHRATVFEALPAPGGMITVGMPRFRLPRETRQADISDIVNLGIEIRTSTPIGKDLSLDDLKCQGYQAILIATGAHKNQRLGIAGEGLSGVIDSVALLQALNLKQPIAIGKRAVVIGGGYTGIDSARTAIRLNCERVLILERRSAEQLLVNAEEVAEALEEGVEIQYLVSPVRIMGREGKVVGVDCVRMKLEPDASGRRRPVPIEGSEFFIEADSVVVAIGQRPDLSFLGGDTTLTEGKNHVVIDRLTMATRVPGIFAAGDVAGQPGTLIDAIAAGRRAAISIDRYLRGEKPESDLSSTKTTPVEVDITKTFIPPIERQPMPCLALKDRVSNFEEVDLGFTAEMALREAKRCLNCAGCSNCRECERACELGAIDHDAVPQQFELEVDAIIVANGTTARSNGSKSPAAGSRRQVRLAERPGVYRITPSRNGDLSHASAVAVRVMADLSKPRHQQRREQKDMLPPVAGAVDKETRIGVFICGCGGSIGDGVDIPGVIGFCRTIPGVAYSGETDYACTDKSAAEIITTIKQLNLTHVVLAACSCCNLHQICFSCSDRRIRCKSNLLDDAQCGVSYEFVNIREQCAWVHSGRGEATSKAQSLIITALARVKEAKVPARKTHPVERGILVIGQGPGGMQAAVDLSSQDFPTALLTHNEQKEKDESPIIDRLKNELKKNGVMILSGAELVDVASADNGYEASVAQNGKQLSFTTGVIIIDLSTGIDGLKRGSGLLAKVLPGNNNQSNALEPVMSRLPGIFFCGTGQAATDIAEALVQGSAAAAKASILLSKGMVDVVETVAIVDRHRCRGCGTCASVCPSGAVMLEQKDASTFAHVDERLCLGCGTCVARCPTGALSQNGGNDNQIVASLEAILP